MHPFGMYLAIRDRERDNGWVDADVPGTPFARVDASPLLEPEPPSRTERLAAALRRLANRERGRVVESLPGGR